MDGDAFVLLVIAVAALAAAAFTVVPVLPGTLFVPLGALAIGAREGFAPFEWWFWAAQGALVVSYLLVDNLAQLVGVKRVGGSRQAMIGGAIGVFVGPIVLAFVLGPFALLVGPPLGAIAGTLVGEQRARRQLDAAEPAAAGHWRRLSLGALAAWAFSTATKLGIVAVQVTLLLFTAR